MALVLRTVVGRPLTWTEGDDNLTYLEQLVPTPGGVDGELQYNDNGTFSGVPDLTYGNGALQATGSFRGNLDGNASTASFVALTGLGITVNNLELTASVRTVNGQLPTNGNVQASLSATKTGDSASLVSSGSGDITASIADGLVWIISNNIPDVTKDGDVYIYAAGAVGEWFPVAPLDEAASNLIYLRLDGAYPMTGNLDMGASFITNVDTVSATNLVGILPSNYVDGPFGSNSIISSSYAAFASFVTASGVLGPHGVSSVLSSSYAVSASWAPKTPLFPYTGSAIITGSLVVIGTATLTSASVVGDMITNVGDIFATPAVIKIVSLTAAEYSGLGTPDANTLYVVI